MQTWLITGTSFGLGRRLTEKLLMQGHCVAATVRKPEALDQLKKEYGNQLWVATLDVTDTIDSVEQKPAPLRLALGGDAYYHVRASLVARLEALDAQKDVALASEIAD